eukprot:13514965-Alexandrium_andersonii.AAC.1
MPPTSRPWEAPSATYRLAFACRAKATCAGGGDARDHCEPHRGRPRRRLRDPCNGEGGKGGRLG